MSVGVLVRILLNPLLGIRLPFITLFPAVFFAAYVGGLWPAVLATVLGTLAALFLFFDMSFAALGSDAIAQLGVAIFSTSGLGMAWLGEARLRAHRKAVLALAVAKTEAARAEEETVRAEEEAARAEEETLRAEEEAARAEREMQNTARATERIDRILASITDGFLVLDHEWTITYLNTRTATLLGRSAADALNHNFWRVFPEIVGSPFEQAYRPPRRPGK